MGHAANTKHVLWMTGVLALLLAETAAVTFQPCGCQGYLSLTLELEQELRSHPIACFVLTLCSCMMYPAF